MRILSVRGKRNIPLLIVLILIIEGLGFLSGFLSNSDSSQYQNLIKPDFAPPGWVFPIIWTILYALMAISLYRIILWSGMGKKTGRGILFFIIQLLMNYTWSFIFFGLNMYGLAFIWLIVMLIFIMLTTIEFSKIDKKAAALMIPYIIWVIYAGVLNLMIFILN